MCATNTAPEAASADDVKVFTLELKNRPLCLVQMPKVVSSLESDADGRDKALMETWDINRLVHRWHGLLFKVLTLVCYQIYLLSSPKLNQ